MKTSGKILLGSRTLRLPKLSYGCCLTAVFALSSSVTPAQEALRNALAGQAVAQDYRAQLQSQAYTFKLKDFRLLASTSLGIDYNDNINTSSSGDQLDDFILRPIVNLAASYPLTQRNLLQLNVGFGYSKYLKHDEFSTWNLNSGSGISFDTYIKSILINLHDRFQYTQDSAREGAVANTGMYGYFQNSAGVNVNWVPNDMDLMLGYDHVNYLSTSEQFKRTDHSSEMFVARAGYRVNPVLTTGVEGTTSLTTYNEKILNENTAYSAGVYADWQPGSHFDVKPRIGYSIYQFDQTSQFVQAQDLDSWYADLKIAHQLTEFFGYSLAGGRETRLGIESDAIEDWYVRPSLNWHLMQNVTLGTGFFFEQGKQSGGTLLRAEAEKYQHYGGDFNIGYSIIRNLSMSLNYRLTFRDSNESSRNYHQNQVGLAFIYTFQ